MLFPRECNGSIEKDNSEDNLLNRIEYVRQDDCADLTTTIIFEIDRRNERLDHAQILNETRDVVLSRDESKHGVILLRVGSTVDWTTGLRSSSNRAIDERETRTYSRQWTPSIERNQNVFRSSYEHLLRWRIREVRSADANDVGQTNRGIELDIRSFMGVEEIVEQCSVETGEEMSFLVVLRQWLKQPLILLQIRFR